MKLLPLLSKRSLKRVAKRSLNERSLTKESRHLQNSPPDQALQEELKENLI